MRILLISGVETGFIEKKWKNQFPNSHSHEIGFWEMFFDSLDEAQGCMEL